MISGTVVAPGAVAQTQCKSTRVLKVAQLEVDAPILHDGWLTEPDFLTYSINSNSGVLLQT
jgi:hypothetical protein